MADINHNSRFQVPGFKVKKSGTLNLEPKTWNLKPEIPGTWNMKPD